MTGPERPEDARTAQLQQPPQQLPQPPSRPLGVPPRPSSLPPPRADGRATRPAGPAGSAAPRPARPRTARLVLKRVDPWSVFLYSVVASLFVGLAIIVAVAVLYFVLSQLGVLSSVNTLIGDVTSDPGTKAVPSQFLSGGRIMTFAVLLAGFDVVLLTALSTLAALLYNVCASLTGGIAVTLSDRD